MAAQASVTGHWLVFLTSKRPLANQLPCQPERFLLKVDKTLGGISMRTLTLLLALSILAGCAKVTVDSFPGPGGQTMHVIDCSKGSFNIGDCHKAAVQVCPAGYEVEDSKSSQTYSAWDRLRAGADARRELYE